MNNTFGIISELIILSFNILFFMHLTVLKHDNKATRLLMYLGSGTILAFFFIATYVWKMSEVTASFIFVTVPTVTFYWILSKHKDARFFVTFCFLDTATLSLTFFARAIDIWFGTVAGSVGYLVVIALMAGFFFWGKVHLGKYRELMNDV